MDPMTQYTMHPMHYAILSLASSTVFMLLLEKQCTFLHY